MLTNSPTPLKGRTRRQPHTGFLRALPFLFSTPPESVPSESHIAMGIFYKTAYRINKPLIICILQIAMSVLL